jgi:hypothetical protein
VTDLDAFGPEPGPPNLGAPAPRRCRRHDRQTWIEATDEWECQKCGTRVPNIRVRAGKSARRLGTDQERRIERVYGPRKVGEFGDAIDLLGRDFKWQSKASRGDPPAWLARCDSWLGIHGMPPLAWRQYIADMDPLRQDLKPLLVLSYVRAGGLAEGRTRDWIVMRRIDWDPLHGSTLPIDAAWVVMTGQHFLDVHGRDEP